MDGEAHGSELLEREQEMAAAHTALLAARDGRGSAIVIEGPAGIGKTEIAIRLQAEARLAGMTSLWARAAEVEADFAFGVVRQLFEGAVRTAGDRALLLDGAALAGALLEDRPVGVEDRLSLLHSVFWLASNLAERAPLLLTIDDAQWCDEASLAFAGYLSRRIADLPALLVLTVRRPEVRKPAALASLNADATVLRPGALSLEASSSVLREQLAAADDDFCAACHRATGGNPFLLHELRREVQRRGIEPTKAGASTVADIAPEGLARTVAHRLEQRSHDARAIAQAVAVLAGPTELRDAASLAELDLRAAARAADELRTAGVLAPTPMLAFEHPLIEHAVMLTIATDQRRLAHRRAAAILDGIGRPPGQVAAHLLASQPAGDPWVVEVLRRAGADALASGEPERAVAYLERARDEPSPAEARAETLLELGLAQARAARPECTTTLAAALAAGVHPDRRADVTLALGRALWSLAGKAHAAVAALAGLDRGGIDPDQALRIDAQRIERSIGWLDGFGGLPGINKEAARAELARLAERAHPPRPASAVLLGTLARESLRRGEPREAAIALALEAITADERTSFLNGSSIDVLIWTEAFDEAATSLDRMIELGRAEGSPYVYAVANLWRGLLRSRLGTLSEAEADCRASTTVMDELNVDWVTFPRAFLADVLLDRDLDAAAALLDATREPAAGFSEFFLLSRTRLWRARGNIDAATTDGRAVAGIAGENRSPGILPWRSELAMTLALADEGDEARALALEEVRLARGQGGPRALGTALRALGLVAADIGHLREAVTILAGSGATLEHARAQVDLGAALRRAGTRTEARDPLRSGLDGALRCGAMVLAARAEDELRAAGGRPRRRAISGVEALTASERRVAELAAQGLSNRQVAQTLFISVWTVATHLTHVYTKLGIDGREQLSHALGLP